MSRAPSRSRVATSLGERGVERRQRGLGDGLGVRRGRAQHARPAQHVGHRQRCEPARELVRLDRGVEHGPGGGGIEAQGVGLLGRLQAQVRLDLAPLEPARDPLACGGLERAQLLGQPQAHVEVTVVDRAQLPDEGAGRGVGAGAGERGHAANHGSMVNGFPGGQNRPGRRRRAFYT